jgi:hypothetical protein
MAQKKISQIKKEIDKINEENELASLRQTQTRARSFTIGSSTGGVIEIAMRGDHSNLWYAANPVEVVEFIYQFAASAGIEVAIRPRNDFASWRGWDSPVPGETHWLGTAPWQLSDEQKQKIFVAKENDIKVLESGEENVE